MNIRTASQMAMYVEIGMTKYQDNNEYQERVLEILFSVVGKIRNCEANYILSRIVTIQSTQDIVTLFHEAHPGAGSKHSQAYEQAVYGLITG